jgi:hypothetical protein
MALPRSKDPVASHCSAASVRGYHRETMSAYGVKLVFAADVLIGIPGLSFHLSAKVAKQRIV